MSIEDSRTELDSPSCEYRVPVPATDPCFGFHLQRSKDPLEDEGEEGESVGEIERRGASSSSVTGIGEGAGGVTTDSDKDDDDEAARDGNNDDALMTAPSRKNKRKMTEPRKRTTDFSIRSLCSHSDKEEEEESEGEEEDRGTRRGEENKGKRTKRTREEDVTAPSSSHLLSPPWSAHTTASSLLSSLSLDPSAAAAAFDRRQGARPGAPSVSDRCPPVVASSFPFDDNRFTNAPPSTRPQRKNYKNMTKQRRIEANARERTRVHTISAAFESLRRAVPSYSYNQRLSKLAILRIASSYILALATLAELDYDGEEGGRQRRLTFGDCVDLCTQTIQAEGRAKRRH